MRLSSELWFPYLLNGIMMMMMMMKKNTAANSLIALITCWALL